MFIRRRLPLALACLGLTPLFGCAPRAMPEMTATVAAHDAVLRDLPRDFYKPGLGDQMNALQLRHAKLWFAGAANNWELAAFELEEIQENLDRIARWHADNKEIPLAPSIKAYTQQGRYALDQSIRQRDATTFAAAFDRFTQGCNQCHQAAQHGFIVIQRPMSDPVGNQSWTSAAH
jgi:hypothetical protein